MSRRILYNPVDFVEASTPFYENLIGMITDQTDRISRNIELAREERIRQEDRDWQEEMLTYRLDAQREMSQERMEFQEEQNMLQRHQNQMQFLDQQKMGVENLRLQWAKLGQQQLTAQQKAANTALNEAQSHLDNLYDNLRSTGLIGGNDPTRLLTFQDEEGNFQVVDTENVDNQGNPRFLGTLDDYVRDVQPLVNFADQFLNGRNVVDWANDNLAKGSDYRDAESDAEIIDRQKFFNLINTIRSGQDFEGNARQQLIDIMDQDSNVRLLMKDDHDVELRDTFKVAQNIDTIVNDLTKIENLVGILFDPEDETKWLDSTFEKDPERFLPRLTNQNFNNINQSFDAQSVGQIGETVSLLAHVHGANDYRIKDMRSSAINLENMAIDYVRQFRDTLPTQFRNVSPTLLARSLRLNPEIINDPAPEIHNMFRFPETIEEMEQYQSGYREKEEWSLPKSTERLSPITNPRFSEFGTGGL